MLSSSISYPVLIKIPYFTHITERWIAPKEGLGGEKEAQRQGEERVNFRISLI
jgi:hypothetical protein